MQRRGPPQPVDVEDLAGDVDPRVGADLLQDQRLGEQRRQQVRGRPARSSPGCSGGSGCIPACTIDGMMLNHAVGIWSCGEVEAGLLGHRRPSCRPGSASLPRPPVAEASRRSGDRRRPRSRPSRRPRARVNSGSGSRAGPSTGSPVSSVEHALARGARDAARTDRRTRPRRARTPRRCRSRRTRTAAARRARPRRARRAGRRRASPPRGSPRASPTRTNSGDQAPRTARNDALQRPSRCRAPRGARGPAASSPGISRPTASAITRSSRWKIPSVSTTSGRLRLGAHVADREATPPA